ncbi:MAG: L-rhamnose/proton symporter RhaT, partial [Candidatus Binatia bacterium]
TLPMKFTRRWKWENIWLVYAVVGLLILPWAIAAWTIPQLMEVYQQSEVRAVVLAIIFGAGWGAGSVLFGLGVERIGMALAFAIILGLTAALGSLVPMMVLHPEEVITAKGGIITAGLGVVLAGIFLCARAGQLKQAALVAQESAASMSPAKTFGSGLLICVLSGLLSPMLNFSLAFGEGIAQRAVELGAEPASAPNAIWALAVCSGFVVNAGYCSYLLLRNKTWGGFSERGTAPYWVLGIVMGALWMFGISVYGMGAANVGELGTVIGWPLFMATIIIMANVWGGVTGEWRGAGPRARRMIVSGVAVLILAIFIIGYGTTL